MTILSTPGTYSSVHDDLIYTVFDTHSTDGVSFPNYKYIADVYVNGTMVVRVKKVQDPTTGVGIFNISQIVRNYIALSFSPVANVLQSQQLGQSQFYVEVQVKFGEEYSYTAYLDLALDSTRSFYNHYNKRLVGSTTDLSVFANKLATNNVLRGSVLLSSKYYFVPYFPITGSLVSVAIEPSNGGTINTSFTPTSFNLQVLNFSPAVVNALSAGAINEATTFYDVTVGTQTYRINIICEAIYDVFAIHFMNQYGGLETKLLTKVSRKILDIQKKKFGKLPYTVDSSGVVNYYNANNVYNETNSVYAAQYKEKLTLNSDLLTDDEYRWLADLVLSPIVYLEDGDFLYPVLIVENNYEPKKNVNDELSNLTLSVEYGNQLSSQYR